MSTKRKLKRSSEKRRVKSGRVKSIAIWTVIIIVLVSLVAGTIKTVGFG